MSLSKQEAAEFLGVSKRALERYTQQGKVGVKYVKGAFGKEAKYSKAELEIFKYSQSAEIHKPALVSESEDISPSASNQLFQLFATLLDKEAKDVPPSLVPIEHKLLLTMREAQALTNLSWSYLREAIDDRRLEAYQIGRGFKIKKADLEKFIKGIR